MSLNQSMKPLKNSASNLCPCCSSVLVKQMSNRRLDWYCSTCRQTMPNLAGSLLELARL